MVRQWDISLHHTRNISLLGYFCTLLTVEGVVIGRFRATRELLSFACSKESNQRKKHPLPLISCAAQLYGRQSETHFVQTAACRKLP